MKRVADRHEGMVDDLEQRLWNLRNKRWKCNYHFTFADQCLPCKENMCEYHTMVMKGPKKRNLSWGCQKCKEIRLKRFAPLVEASQQPVPPSKCEEKPPEPESAIPAPKKAAPRYKPVVRSTAASKKKETRSKDYQNFVVRQSSGGKRKMPTVHRQGFYLPDSYGYCKALS